MSEEKIVDYIELDDEELFEKMDEIQKKYDEKLEKLFKDFEEKNIKKEIGEIRSLGSDIGYGSMGNINKYHFLHDCLNENDRKEYEMELKEKDPSKYHEYKIWEKSFEYMIKK